MKIYKNVPAFLRYKRLLQTQICLFYNFNVTLSAYSKLWKEDSPPLYTAFSRIYWVLKKAPHSGVWMDLSAEKRFHSDIFIFGLLFHLLAVKFSLWHFNWRRIGSLALLHCWHFCFVIPDICIHRVHLQMGSRAFWNNKSHILLMGHFSFDTRPIQIS